MSGLSQVRLRCRRGMKELDYVLDRYLDQHYPQADDAEKVLLDELLELQDPVLFRFLFGMDDVPAHLFPLVLKIRQSKG